MSAWDQAWSAWSAEGSTFIPAMFGKAEDAGISDTFARHQEWTDALLSDFTAKLKPIVDGASSAVGSYLQGALAVTEGVIDPTAANDAILSGIAARYESELADAGLPELIAEFTGSFPGQLPFLQETMDSITNALGRAPEKIDFTAREKALLARAEVNASAKIDSVVRVAAEAASERALLSIAGLPFKDLVSEIATQTGRSITAATGWADTAVSMWYRTATDRAFQVIEDGLPTEVHRYRYVDPLDKVTRPFCRHLLSAGKSYTRAEVDDMDNGQIPGVFVSAGGFRCRHQWLLAIN